MRLKERDRNIPNLLIDSAGGIATLILNRAAKKNALSVGLRDEFRAFLQDKESSVKVAVLTGDGNTFSSGMDLSEPGGEQVIREMWTLIKGIYESDIVFIAAVNGPARGAGLTLVNACDFAIADPSADFGIPEIRHGFYGPGAVPTTQLAVPKKFVAEMALAGGIVSAERAAQAFLVNSVSAPGASLAEALQLAERLAKMKASALATVKKGLNSLPYGDALRDQGLELALDLNRALVRSGELRAPNQTGRYNSGSNEDG